jgi:hypothetical protein
LAREVIGLGSAHFPRIHAFGHLVETDGAQTKRSRLRRRPRSFTWAVRLSCGQRGQVPRRPDRFVGPGRIRQGIPIRKKRRLFPEIELRERDIVRLGIRGPARGHPCRTRLSRATRDNHLRLPCRSESPQQEGGGQQPPQEGGTTG